MTGFGTKTMQAYREKLAKRGELVYGKPRTVMGGVMVKHAAQWPMQVSIELNRLAADQKTVAERKWSSGLKPTAPQKPCDAGLFSDDKDQTEML